MAWAFSSAYDTRLWCNRDSPSIARKPNDGWFKGYLYTVYPPQSAFLFDNGDGLYVQVLTWHVWGMAVAPANSVFWSKGLWSQYSPRGGGDKKWFHRRLVVHFSKSPHGAGRKLVLLLHFALSSRCTWRSLTNDPTDCRMCTVVIYAFPWLGILYSTQPACFVLNHKLANFIEVTNLFAKAIVGKSVQESGEFIFNYSLYMKINFARI